MAIDSAFLKQNPDDPNQRTLQVTYTYGTPEYNAVGDPGVAQYTLTQQQYAQLANSGIPSTISRDPNYYLKGSFDVSRLGNLNNYSNGGNGQRFASIFQNIANAATTNPADLALDSSTRQHWLDYAMGGQYNPLTPGGLSAQIIQAANSGQQVDPNILAAARSGQINSVADLQKIAGLNTASGNTTPSANANPAVLSASTPTPSSSAPSAPFSNPVPSGATIDLSRGDQYFVRFPSSHGNTVYLYDKNQKIFVPFTSEQSFSAFTGGVTVGQAGSQGQIHDLDPSVQQSMGVIVPDAAGFGTDGHVMDQSYYQNLSTSGLNSMYGKTKNPAMETQAADAIGTLFTTLKNSGSISQSTFDKYIKDPTNLAAYINAWVYGGYTADDIFRDVKGKELGLNTKAIDPTISASQFYQTPDHATVVNNAQLAPPTNLGIDPSLFNNPVFSIPGDAFKTLIPPLDKNSQTYKDQVSSVKDSYHDLLLQQLDAKTAQEKAIADTNYKEFKNQLQQKYGIQLSDNATSAWSQVEQLGTSASNNGMSDSGVFNEALDKLLATTRLNDQRGRTNEGTEANNQKKQYYTTQATPSQIQNDLTPAERQAWGLAPAQGTLDFINNLKASYPDLTDDQIKQMKDSLIDENGNLRSQLYSNLYQNRMTQTQAKSLYQENTVQAKNDKANQDAYAPYTQSDNPFLRYTGTKPNLPSTSPTPGSSNSSSNPSYNPTYQTPSSSNTAPVPSTNEVKQALDNPGSVYSPPSSQKDLSSQYGLHKGTVYNLNTGFGYTNSQDFFKDAGITDFSQAKLNTGYAPSFYKYNSSYQNNPASTVYSGLTNKALDYDSYMKSGGSADFSNVATRNS